MPLLPKIKSVRIPKRRRFFLSALALTVSIFVAFFALRAFLPPAALLLILLILSLTVFLTFWILDFDLRLPEHLIFIAYPLVLTADALSYSNIFLQGAAFGLPHLLFGVFVALGYYLLFATLNVLNVATVRTLPLKKAALTTFSSFALMLNFLSVYRLIILHPPHFALGMILAALAPMILLPLFYATEIEFGAGTLGLEILGRPPLRLKEGLILSLIFGEVTTLVSFWRVPALLTALFLTALLSSLLGVWQHHLQKNLTGRIIYEHVFVFLAMFLVFIWAGSGR